MKRIICMLTAIMIVLIFAGCTADTSVPPTEESVQSTQFTVPPESTETADPETEPSAPPTTEEIDPTETAQTEAFTEAPAPKCEHEYRYKTLKEPTCTTSGVRKFTCTKCGDSYMSNLDPLDHAFVITKTEPDCVNSGGTTYHCKVCEYTYTDHIKPALGHDYGPLRTIKNPTELLPGIAEHTCIRCSKVEQVELPKLTPAP